MPIGIHRTMGRAGSEACLIEELLVAGTDAFPLNLSHYQAEHLPRLVKLIRKVSQGIRKPVQIAPDFRGRHLRLGPFDMAHHVMGTHPQKR
jgi:pyruvate kinase